MLLFYIFVVIESLILAVLLFGDIGFDHPGRYGLDFDDSLMLTFVFCLVALMNLVYIISNQRWTGERRWALALGQIFGPFVLCLLYLFAAAPLA